MLRDGGGGNVLRRPLAATLGLLIVVGGWQVFAALNERAHLSPAVEGVLRAQGRADVDVVVHFPPEKFHLLYFQERGRVVGLEGVVVHMKAVPAREIRHMARQYWIAHVRLGNR